MTKPTMDATMQPTGALVQAYARARWGNVPDKPAAERIAAGLDREVRDRVDRLGFDAERLIAVGVEEVLRELEALEAEAALEDSGARSAADRVRTQEVRGGHAHKTPWRRGGQPSPGPRSSGVGKRRPREW